MAFMGFTVLKKTEFLPFFLLTAETLLGASANTNMKLKAAN